MYMDIVKLCYGTQSLLFCLISGHVSFSTCEYNQCDPQYLVNGIWTLSHNLLQSIYVYVCRFFSFDSLNIHHSIWQQCIWIFSLIITGTAILFCYLNYITFFLGCMTINEHRVSQNRHFFTCRITKSKEEMKEAKNSKIAILCCAGSPHKHRNPL
jgi:hypothetical protein